MSKKEKDWLKHLKNIASSGGKATLKKHGNKHFKKLSALAVKKRWGNKTKDGLQ